MSNRKSADKVLDLVYLFCVREIDNTKTNDIYRTAMINVLGIIKNAEYSDIMGHIDDVREERYREGVRACIEELREMEALRHDRYSTTHQGPIQWAAWLNERLGERG